MLIFLRARIALLATPKCASTALAAALAPAADLDLQEPPALKHMTPAAFDAGLRGELEREAGGRFTSVALMREPVDWLMSWYRYRTRPRMLGTPVSTAEISAAGFAQAWLGEPRPAFADVSSQARFLTGGGGRVLADRLFRYEDLPGLIAFLAAAGIAAAPLRKVKVSPPADSALPEDLAARLRARLAPDYAIWEAIPLSAAAATPSRSARSG
jgi:hypothetical protein